MRDKLKPYQEYKSCGQRWVGQIPVHWMVQRGKALFAPGNIPVRPQDEIVTCFRDGQVTLRRNRRAGGFMVALKEVGYQGVRRGQLVIHAMDAFAGAVGVSDSDGKCSPEYIVCNPRQRGLTPRYYAYLLRLAAHQRYIEVVCEAVRERAPRLRYPNFGDMRLPVPSEDEQAAIVKYLDHVDRKINRYIRDRNRLISLVREERSVAVMNVVHAAPKHWSRLDTISHVISRPVQREARTPYTAVGLFNRGRGIFHKSACPGAELGDSEFCWIEPGDLVISGQFAWEGSVAIATEDDKNCIASHRYPILRGNEVDALTGWLLAFLQSGLGNELLNHHSRGGAGRNRPLNLRTLLKEKVPVPFKSDQTEIVQMLNREQAIVLRVRDTIEALKAWRQRLITDVVTGKLDVRAAAAKLADVIDEEPAEGLDEIEAEAEETIEDLSDEAAE